MPARKEGSAARKESHPEKQISVKEAAFNFNLPCYFGLWAFVENWLREPDLPAEADYIIQRLYYVAWGLS